MPANPVSDDLQCACAVYVDPAWQHILQLHARGHKNFHILELGFGFGTNLSLFLDLWSKHSQADWFCYFQTVELSPQAINAIENYWKSLPQAQRDRLDLSWIDVFEHDGAYALPGIHRYQLHDRLIFDLHVGEPLIALKRLNTSFDLVFLYGGPRALNPSLWSSWLLRLLRRQLLSEALVLSYAASKSLRNRLSSLEFQVRRRQLAFTRKCRLEASYRPYRRLPARPPSPSPTSLMIIGAGLAGQCLAHAAHARGLACVLIDPKDQQDQHADAQLPAWLEHLHFSPDDNELARLSRAALLLAQGHLARKLRSALSACTIGRRQLLRTPTAREAWLQRWESLRHKSAAPFDPWQALFCVADPSHVYLPRSRAVMLPKQLPTKQIRSSVSKVLRDGDQWRAYDDLALLLASADALVVTSPQALVKLCLQSEMVLQLKPGVSLIIEISALDTQHPVWRLSSILADQYHMIRLEEPPRLLVGALYGEPDELEAKHALLQAAQELLSLEPYAWDRLSQCPSKLWRGMRYSAPDHLPLIGPLADDAAVDKQWESLKSNTRLPIPRLEKAYTMTGLGARGALWAPFGAEILLDLMHAIPCPLESDLLASIDPARALIRHMRRGIRHNHSLSKATESYGNDSPL